MDLSREQKLLVIGGLLVLLAGIVVLSLARVGSAPPPTVYQASTTSAPPPQALAVHVTGAVTRPGLYWLQPGSRVSEAIGMAGGMTPEANSSSINLAALVQDGQQIVVTVLPPATAADHSAASTPPAPSPVPASTPTPPPPQASPQPQPRPSPTPVVVYPLSLNAATKEQLETLPEIGPQLAQRILYYRYEHGGFRSVEELTNVEGIGKHRLALLRQYLQP